MIGCLNGAGNLNSKRVNKLRNSNSIVAFFTTLVWLDSLPEKTSRIRVLLLNKSCEFQARSLDAAAKESCRCSEFLVRQSDRWSTIHCQFDKIR